MPLLGAVLIRAQKKTHTWNDEELCWDYFSRPVFVVVVAAGLPGPTRFRLFVWRTNVFPQLGASLSFCEIFWVLVSVSDSVYIHSLRASENYPGSPKGRAAVACFAFFFFSSFHVVVLGICQLDESFHWLQLAMINE